MKQNIKLTGTVELTEQELRGILYDFAKKKKSLVYEAVSEYLGAEHNLTVKKTQRPEDGTVIAIVERQEANDDVKPLGKPEPIERNAKGGYRKKYLGYFKYAKDIFAGWKQEGKKKVTVEDFLREIRKYFVDISKQRATQYLYDVRQFKGKDEIKFDSKNELIYL